MLTETQWADIRSRMAALTTWLGKRTSYKPEEVAHLNPPTNDERSAVELFEFMRDKPDRYFLYIKDGLPHQPWVATTWTGETLGSVNASAPYRDNFGGLRQPVWVRAVNGCTYQGTYYKSLGSYARVRKVKSA